MIKLYTLRQKEASELTAKANCKVIDEICTETKLRPVDEL